MAAQKSRFKECTVTATLPCAGNRRAHIPRNASSTSGLQWNQGAIGTATFTGARLRDVLIDAGYNVDTVYNGRLESEVNDQEENVDRHVHFRSPGDTYFA